MHLRPLIYFIRAHVFKSSIFPSLSLSRFYLVSFIVISFFVTLPTCKIVYQHVSSPSPPTSKPTLKPPLNQSNRRKAIPMCIENLDIYTSPLPHRTIQNIHFYFSFFYLCDSRLGSSILTHPPPLQAPLFPVARDNVTPWNYYTPSRPSNLRYHFSFFSLFDFFYISFYYFTQ